MYVQSPKAVGETTVAVGVPPERPQTPVKVETKNWFDVIKLWGMNQCWERTGSSGKRREQCTNQPASREVRSAEFPGLKAKNQAWQQQKKCRLCRFGTSDTVEVWKVWKIIKMDDEVCGVRWQLRVEFLMYVSCN